MIKKYDLQNIDIELSQHNFNPSNANFILKTKSNLINRALMQAGHFFFFFSNHFLIAFEFFLNIICSIIIMQIVFAESRSILGVVWKKTILNTKSAGQRISRHQSPKESHLTFFHVSFFSVILSFFFFLIMYFSRIIIIFCQWRVFLSNFFIWGTLVGGTAS